MSNPQHHGTYSFEGKNTLNTFSCYTQQTAGRFGRMFSDLPPLYCHPSALIGMGQQGGPMDSKTTSSLTNNVPLGMIFFGQFIDHDLTFDTTSSFSNVNAPANFENVRTARFDLDSVFGGGPEDTPFMYLNEPFDLHLLTGATNKNPDQTASLEVHDLARSGSGRAIIGDPRNDENRIISQLQLAFIRFYNAVYTTLSNDNNTLPQTKRKAPMEIYKDARKLVTWHYQWIVLNEFFTSYLRQKNRR